MKKFIEFLRNKNAKYIDIVITGVEYDLTQNVLRIKAQYTCDNFLDSTKEELERDICAYFNNSMLVECKMKKYLVDIDVVKEYVTKFLESNYPSAINKKSGKVNVSRNEDNIFVVGVDLDKDNFDYLSSSEFVNEVIEYLRLITKEDYEIKLNCVEDTTKSRRDILRQRYDQINSGEMVKAIDYEPIEVRCIHNVVGEIDVDFVYPIATITEQEKAILVGTISYYKIKEYESKYKHKDGTAKTAKRANFLLSDGSDKINCVYFPNTADEEKLEDFGDGEKVVVIGDVTDSEDRGRSCKIKSIALCDFDPIIIEQPEIEIKTVNEEYQYIFPKPFAFNKQSNLFVEKEQIDDFLMNNTVVVFDLETTGLDINTCEIIEIGAVKMVEGKITETFDTLIKPKGPIPPDATAVNNITDEMVEDCLSIDLVFPDFYKFIDGAVLCAYNIGYDCGVLKVYGDRTGYVINNKQVDVLKLARKALPSHKSYKLGRIVKQLKITLDNAHRALFDTIATAEVLKRTLNLLDDESKKPILGL